MSDLNEIKENLVVEFDYTLTDKDGKELDSSKDNGPLAYLHGKQNIIPGLENELTGKKIGDAFKITIEPDEAYGEYKDELVQIVPSSQFEGMGDIEVGAQFQVETDAGGNLIVTITAIEGDNVTLDGNHPLAGMQLTFDVKVVSIREATEEELSHGHIHAHGEGCEH